MKKKKIDWGAIAVIAAVMLVPETGPLEPVEWVAGGAIIAHELGLF